MLDLAERVKKLEAKAKGQKSDAIAADTAEKRKQWARVQDEAPEMADFLTNINRVFGKPQKLKIEINNEVLINTYDV